MARVDADLAAALERYRAGSARGLVPSREQAGGLGEIDVRDEQPCCRTADSEQRPVRPHDRGRRRRARRSRSSRSRNSRCSRRRGRAPPSRGTCSPDRRRSTAGSRPPRLRGSADGTRSARRAAPPSGRFRDSASPRGRSRRRTSAGRPERRRRPDPGEYVALLRRIELHLVLEAGNRAVRVDDQRRDQQPAVDDALGAEDDREVAPVPAAAAIAAQARSRNAASGGGTRLSSVR